MRIFFWVTPYSHIKESVHCEKGSFFSVRLFFYLDIWIKVKIIAGILGVCESHIRISVIFIYNLFYGFWKVWCRSFFGFFISGDRVGLSCFFYRNWIVFLGDGNTKTVLRRRRSEAIKTHLDETMRKKKQNNVVFFSKVRKKRCPEMSTDS